MPTVPFEPVDTDEVHEFLLDTGERKYAPALLVQRLREAIQELPETSGTFPLNALDVDGVMAVRPIYMEFIGSWQIPDVYAGTGRTTTYVNPHNPDTHLYSDAYVECECGAVMVREERVHGDTVMQAEHEHTEDCRRQWRLHARARLAEQRREMLIRMYRLRLEHQEMVPRLGLEGRDSLGPIADAIGVDSERHRHLGRQIAANTMVELLRKHPPSVVGDVYGISGQAVRRNVDKLSDTTPGDLYEYRRENGHDNLS